MITIKKMLPIFLIGFVFCVQAQEITLKDQYNISFNKDYWISMHMQNSGLAIDAEGNKVVVGSFSGQDVAFDASHLLSTGIESNAFIAKYNSENEIIWMKSIGGSQHEETGVGVDRLVDVRIDEKNNIYVIGDVDVFVSDTIDLDPEHPETHSIIETLEFDPWEYSYMYNPIIIIAKYSPEGSLMWYKEFKLSFNYGYRISFDQSNNLIVTGSLGNFLFDYDFDTTRTFPNDEDILTAYNCFNAFIARYTPDGDFIDVKGIDGGVVRELNAYATPSGNFYITGNYHSSYGLEFFINDDNPYKIPKSATIQDCAGLKEDVFIAKYNSTGQVQWAKTINSLLYDKATEIQIDENENVYVSGCFRGSNVDFDLDNTLAYDTKSAVSGGTAYVAKYEPVNGDLVWLKTIEGGSSSEALDMVIKDGEIIIGGQFKGMVSMGSLSLSAEETAPFMAVIDTAGNWVTAKEIEQETSSAISNLFIAGDGTIHFMGHRIQGISSTIRASNLDGFFIGEAFCDELIDIVPVQITLNENACNTYISPGGKAYTTSGVYSDTVFNSLGDTVYTINLKVSNLDAEIDMKGNVLMAKVSDACYQWIDCVTNAPVEGATNQIFTVAENGSYAVIVDNSICIDTSDCAMVNTTGTDDGWYSEDLEIFPNPTSEVLQIKSALNIRQVSLYDVAGNLVLCQLAAGNIAIDKLPKGIYVVRVITDLGTVYTKRVLKE